MGKYRVSIPRLISLIVGLIIVFIGFLFLGAGFVGLGTTGYSSFVKGATFLTCLFLAIVFWGIGAIFVFIGRKAFEYKGED